MKHCIIFYCIQATRTVAPVSNEDAGGGRDDGRDGAGSRSGLGRRVRPPVSAGQAVDPGQNIPLSPTSMKNTLFCGGLTVCYRCVFAEEGGSVRGKRLRREPAVLGTSEPLDGGAGGGGGRVPRPRRLPQAIPPG